MRGLRAARRRGGAARALLLLVRPNSQFLKDFQKDTAEGEYVFPDSIPTKTTAEIKDLEIRAITLSFVDTEQYL